MQHVHGLTHNHGHTLDLLVSKGLNIKTSSKMLHCQTNFALNILCLCSCHWLLINSLEREDISHQRWRKISVDTLVCCPYKHNPHLFIPEWISSIQSYRQSYWINEFVYKLKRNTTIHYDLLRDQL